MNNKITKIFFSILFAFSFSLSYGQWFNQQSGTTNNLQCVFFTDAQTGYACGDNMILKTGNAGDNWVKTDLQGLWNSIYFVNAATGYLCGYNGKILKTTNSGANWFTLNSGTTQNLTSIRFKDENTGYFTGWSKTLLKTTDAGITFTSLFGSAYYMWQEIFFINNYIFLMGNDGALFRSTNFGNTWDSLYTGMPNSLSSAQFYENGKGFIFGCCGAIFTTTNFGEHWNHDTVYLTQGWALEDCYFTGNLGWSVGEYGSIVRTSNAGNSWETLLSGTEVPLRSVKFVNSSTGWIVGGEGKILKTTNGGGAGNPIGIENLYSEVPNDFKLFQNYPNPFNPSTKIKFALNVPANIKVSIYNNNGKLENIIAEDFYRAGEYLLTWNAVNKPTGIYYARIETERGSETIKMLLIK